VVGFVSDSYEWGWLGNSFLIRKHLYDCWVVLLSANR
jgi:hypothetical protein